MTEKVNSMDEFLNDLIDEREYHDQKINNDRDEFNNRETSTIEAVQVLKIDLLID